MGGGNTMAFKEVEHWQKILNISSSILLNMILQQPKMK